MDNLFGEIDCRSKSDGIVMGILRCAMDKAHEKVQCEAGSIEFLHERSKFYELAVILVESGLSIIQEETDILESNREKVISDLTEMRHWLFGRIEVMKLLINEKDRELTERIENELKLREILKSKEKEVFYLRDKLENQRTMSEGSLDLELLVKKNKEDEISDSKSDSELLNEETFQKDSIFYGSYNHIPKIKPMMKDSLCPEQNNVIQQMSCDIDILNETLDFAFGRRDNGEMVPIEKQWKCSIEKDTLSILIKGFIQDIKHRFQDTLKENVEIVIFEKDILYVLLRGFISDFQQELGDQTPIEFSNDNLEEFIGEMTILREELEAFCNKYEDRNKTISNQDLPRPLTKIQRTCSEPLPSIDQEDYQEVSGNINDVAKLIKDHESVIRKQLEDQNHMKKEVFRGERSALHKKEKEVDFLNVMVKNIITRLDDISSLSLKLVDKSYVKCKEKYIMKNISKSTIGDKVVTNDCTCEIIRDDVGVPKEDTENLNLQVLILEEIYLIIYEGLYKEMFKAWKDEIDDFYMEVEIREDFYKFMMVEAVKDVHTKMLNYLNHPYKKVEIDRIEEIKIEKLDSTLKCLETKEDPMVKASSEIEEHNEQEILGYEGFEECETIKWLLNDDVCTFSSVNEKLEITMKQLSTCKELLFDLEQSLDVSPDVLDISSDDCAYTNNTSLVVETKKPSQESIAKIDDNQITLINPYNVLISAQLFDFHQMIQEFEINVVQNLEMKSLRIEELKHQFHNFIIEPIALMKKKKLLYKKAFLARCQNLKLAETEVDLLGNQVEELLHLLKNIYIILDQNSTILSCHFQLTSETFVEATDFDLYIRDPIVTFVKDRSLDPAFAGPDSTFAEKGII
ncbi:WPP domain-associated protein [Solanum lycopersicum]|uniref:WPP domain-associated protein n=1 Tax=Solanum lycopersicum TaxID=4081 RepID=UPI0002BCC20C|nr:WPP domain-associated protein [Solanum lycopersicum]